MNKIQYKFCCISLPWKCVPSFVVVVVVVEVLNKMIYAFLVFFS